MRHIVNRVWLNVLDIYVDYFETIEKMADQEKWTADDVIISNYYYQVVYLKKLVSIHDKVINGAFQEYKKTKELEELSETLNIILNKKKDI